MTNEIDNGVVSQDAINAAIDELSKSKYSQQNRVPLITGEYRKETFLKLKDLFMQELYKAAQEEEEACKKVGIEPQMKDDKLKYVEELIESFNNWFQLEALYEFLFKDNIIPTLQEVNARAEKLNDNLGKLEL
jgi:hypothetical protein